MLTKVRFIKPWRTFSVGQIIKPNGLMRDHLLHFKIVEVVDDTEIEEASNPPQMETADAPKKRGRPRKQVEVPVEDEVI